MGKAVDFDNLAVRVNALQFPAIQHLDVCSYHEYSTPLSPFQ